MHHVPFLALLLLLFPLFSPFIYSSFIPISMTSSSSSTSSSSASPLRHFFKSNPSKEPLPPNPSTQRGASISSSRLQKLFKGKNAVVPGADRDRVLSAVENESQPLSILYNLIMSSGTSPSSSHMTIPATTTTGKNNKRPTLPIPQAATSSMLLPPISLFPSPLPQKTSSTMENNKPLRNGLFTKSKQERVTIATTSTSVTDKPSKEKKQRLKTTIDTSSTPSPSQVSSRPWSGWGGGGGGGATNNSTPQITIQKPIDDSSKREGTKDGGGARRMWRSLSPSRSSERMNEIESEDRISKHHKLAKTKPPKSPTASDLLYPRDQQQQIMLHPSSNISSRTVALSSSTSSLCLCHSDEQQQQPMIHSRQEYFNQSCQQQQQLSKSTPSRFNVTLAVHDILGVGKVTEMMLALFLAHDAFLCRRPFWLQCSILAWEAIVVLMVLWTIMRVVGLAEVVVWGTDDLVRGTVSILRQLAQAIRILFSR